MEVPTGDECSREDEPGQGAAVVGQRSSVSETSSASTGGLVSGDRTFII